MIDNKIVKLPEVVWFQEGPGVRNTQYTTEGVKLLNVANLVDGIIDLSTSNRFISNEEAYGKYKHFLCEEGDFIVAGSGIQVSYIDKKMGFIEKKHLPLCMNTSTIRFRSLDNEVLNIRYFMYFIKSNLFKQQLEKHITGSAQLNYGPSHLKKMGMPLPDLSIQNDIVKKIDNIQKIIDRRQNEIELLDNLVKSRFVEMFGNDKYQKKRLSALTSKITKGTTPTTAGYQFVDEGVNFFKIESINDDHTINLLKVAHVNSECHNAFKRSQLQEGDILFSIAGAIGKTAIIQKRDLPGNTNQALAIIRLESDSEITQRFLISALESPLVTEQYERNKRGVAQTNLSLQDVGDLEVFIPPIDKQLEFIKFVEQVDKSKFEILTNLMYLSKINIWETLIF